MKLAISLLVLIGMAAGAAGDTWAKGSCTSEYARCSERCRSNLAGDTPDACRRKHCDSKMASCRQTGCWQQDARFGGAVTCGLSK